MGTLYFRTGKDREASQLRSARRPLASPHPTVVQLSASDGDNTHVVGIAGDWIFDSNRHHALPLSKESLDACCIGRATFSHASYAVRLVPGKKMLKRKRDGCDGSSKAARM